MLILALWDKQDFVLLSTATHAALHPENWGVNVTFIDNKLTSNQPNAIYVDSIQSNIWSDSFKRTFCWKGWFYKNQHGCNAVLRSGPAYVNFTGPYNLTIYPGDSIESKYTLQCATSGAII